MSDTISTILLVTVTLIVTIFMWDMPNKIIYLNVDIIFTRPYSWIKAILMLLGGRIVCRVFNGYYVVKLDKWIREE